MSDLILFDEEKMTRLNTVCHRFAKSNLIPPSLRNKPDDILIIMVMADELGIPFMQSLTSISVIQGKPTMSPDLMCALVRKKLPRAVIKHEIDMEKQIATCTTARSREDLEEGLGYTAKWDMNRAAMMGLATKDNYKKQPVTMLKHRATGEACRAMFPDILLGIYASEEFQDFDGDEIEKPAMRTIKEVDAICSEDQVKKINELVFDINEFDEAAFKKYLSSEAKTKIEEYSELSTSEAEKAISLLIQKRDAETKKAQENEND